MSENPLLSIWTRPRATIRKIIENRPGHEVLILAGIAGIGETLNRVAKRGAGDHRSLETILLVSLILGPFGGMFSLWFYSHFVHWTGKWIGGKAPRESLSAAIAWGGVPYIASVFLWIPMLLIFGSELFKSEAPRIEADPTLKSLLFAITLLQLALSFWTYISVSKTVAEVQGFVSAWRGFANLLLAFLVVVAIIILVVGILLLLL
ncbi:Yip1 family protein [Planctomicrobium sp. SH661]|uniref:Yip1 family protein n=1 Tax=Planctomicrobium sp. SH661 TaxID=3448124 RepID=UPI003F5C167C